MTHLISGRRGRLLLPLASAVLLASACGGDDEDHRDRAGDDDDLPASLADLEWEPHSLAAGDLDTCGSVAVMADLDQDLHVVLVDEDRVWFPEVTPPPGADLEIDDDWFTSGGCVPTSDGPVVVVETQEEFVDLDEAGPKVVAGFTPEGEQLWSVEVPPQQYGDGGGRGAIVLNDISIGGEGDWTVLDARTGETIASGDEVEAQPTTAISPTLVGDLEAGLIELPEGRALGGGGTQTAQVDDARALIEDVDGLRLVALPDLELIWPAAENVAMAGLWIEVADLSTATVVAFDADRRMVGLDLETGEQKWASEVTREEVNSLALQIGSGVVVLRASGDDSEAQVLIDTATGERLTGAEGYVVADQGLLLEVVDEVPTPVTVDDLR